jgi:hypothetical protein
MRGLFYSHKSKNKKGACGATHGSSGSGRIKDPQTFFGLFPLPQVFIRFNPFNPCGAEGARFSVPAVTIPIQ